MHKVKPLIEYLYQVHEHQDKRQKKNTSKEEVEESNPPSFSQIDLSLPDDLLTKQYPLFPGRSAAIECHVKEGQMLYLPAGKSSLIEKLHCLHYAGWFHNVTSMGKDGETNIHMALNYWCYPPDNISYNNKEEACNAFKRPYFSDYWHETQIHKCS